jgi:hypothetical protein
VLITWESSVGAISAFNLTTTLHLLLYLAYHYFMHLLCTNHKCTHPCYFPCYSNLLLRRWRWCGILWWGVLGLRCPDCIFLWIMESSDVLLSRELLSLWTTFIRVIVILYLWQLALLWTCLLVCVEYKCSWAHIRWVFIFDLKFGYDMSQGGGETEDWCMGSGR